MPRSACVLLACDYPGCTRKPHVIVTMNASPYDYVEKLYKKKAEGWAILSAHPTDGVFCPDHGPEVIAATSRMEGWKRRHYDHVRNYGEKSGDAWAAKYPPPEMPEWLATLDWRYAARCGTPTAKAVARLAEIEASTPAGA